MRDDQPEFFLFDTNVISEVKKERPDKIVMEWLDVWETQHTFISVVSLFEIRKGIHKMPVGKRRMALESWLTKDLPRVYGDRILLLNAQVADIWGRLVAEYPYDPIDMIFAATALEHQLTLVTRNEKHFKIRGLRVMNPWLKYGA